MTILLQYESANKIRTLLTPPSVRVSFYSLALKFEQLILKTPRADVPSQTILHIEMLWLIILSGQGGLLYHVQTLKE